MELFWLGVFLLGAPLGPAEAAPGAPRIAKVIPADGSRDVSPEIGKIVIVFDRNMDTGSHSLVAVKDGPFPPMIFDDDSWRDPVTFVLKLKPLRPDASYAIGLNDATHRGFRSADGKVPLAPAVIAFRTGAAGKAPGASPDAGPGKKAPAPATPAIAGEWLFRNDAVELRATLAPDGTFHRTFRTAGGVEESRGKYSYDGKTLTLRPEGAGEEELTFPCRLVDPDTLEVLDEDGNGMRLVRQGDRSVPATPGTPAAGEKAAGKRPTVVFERRWEPKERAFTILAPRGWILDGGIFNVSPIAAGGPGNSLMPKCDLTVKSDEAGTKAFRWLPSYNYADLSVGQFALTSGLFPPGSMYQGMRVVPLPTWEAFLLDLARKNHPGAAGLKVVGKEPIPELAEIFRKLGKDIDAFCQGIGVPPGRYDAGGILVEYAEGGKTYREGMVAAIIDRRGSAAQWTNECTLAMRAPVEEAGAWKTTFDIIRQSLRFDPKWLDAAVRAAGERGKMAYETMQYIQRVDREILENRRKTNADIRYENYLLVTGQEDYVNPYTKEVEVDTSDYKYRWTTSSGNKLYTDVESVDPNRDRDLNGVEWKRTLVRKRD
jgi:hypothetical protein